MDDDKITRLIFLLRTKGWIVNRFVNRLVIYNEVFELESYIINFEPRFTVIVNSSFIDSLRELRLLVTAVNKNQYDNTTLLYMRH